MYESDLAITAISLQLIVILVYIIHPPFHTQILTTYKMYNCMYVYMCVYMHNQ
jgi:hypothetical protein